MVSFPHFLLAALLGVVVWEVAGVLTNIIFKAWFPPEKENERSP